MSSGTGSNFLSLPGRGCGATTIIIAPNMNLNRHITSLSDKWGSARLMAALNLITTSVNISFVIRQNLSGSEANLPINRMMYLLLFGCSCVILANGDRNAMIMALIAGLWLFLSNESSCERRSSLILLTILKMTALSKLVRIWRLFRNLNK